MVWNPLSLPRGQLASPIPRVLQLQVFKTIDSKQTMIVKTKKAHLSRFNTASGSNGINGSIKYFPISQEIINVLYFNLYIYINLKYFYSVTFIFN